MNASEDQYAASNLHQLVYDTVTESIIVANKRGVIVEVNPAAEVLFGYEKKVLLGMSVEELLPHNLREQHKHHRGEYSKNAKPRLMGHGLDLIAETADGGQVSVEVSLNYTKYKGEFHVVALISDISERKKGADRILHLNRELEEGVARRTAELDKAVRALEESQHLYTLIAQNFPDGSINVLNRELKYVFAEGMEFAQYGKSQVDLIGTTYLSSIREEDVKVVRGELRKALSGSSRIFEINREGRTYIINAVPLFDQGKAVSRLMVVEKNISEQKQAERDMVSALSKERELNELKSRFVSMASHEFRTPLGTILSSISLVERYAELNDHEKIQKHVGRVKNSVRNLTSILNDFLSLEKLEQGRIACSPEKIDIQTFIENVCGDIEPMVKNGQALHLNFQVENPMVILDPQLIRNILFNLLSNAIKYSPENKDIELNVDLKDKLIIKVVDYGMGIPKDDQEHLFERFFRAKNATNIQGTGLGLNIVKRYTEIMMGTISFSSSEEGTTFELSFPRELIEL